MKKCHVIFPGKFKPAHSGHIEMVFKYLESKKYDVDLTIVISKIVKDGITPEISEKFLKSVFIKYPKVHVKISDNNSPVMDVYNMTAQKIYGDGIYAMAASSKGSDMKRVEDYCKAFSKTGKYYTPGVEVISFPINTDPAQYVGRTDAYANAEISATILRNDIRNEDYNKFKTGYTELLKSGVISEKILKEYFNWLKDEILPVEDKSRKYKLAESYQGITGKPLFEGGAAGHIPHPYEINDFTFGDLKNLVTDLFHGEITELSEKLDGQNLFASVDEYGNTIFARNNKHLTQEPWYMKDIENNPKWIDHPTVQHAFTNAAITVDKVFKNLDNPVEFFNNKSGDRKWVNLEIIDTQNSNVIPYEKSIVSFHCIKLVTVVMDKQTPLISDDPDNTADMEKLAAAICKTTRVPFEARCTKKLDVIKSDTDSSEKYIKELNSIRDRYKLTDNNTILDYKKSVLKQYLRHSHLPFMHVIDGDILHLLIDRWVGDGKRQRIRDICANNKCNDGLYPDVNTIHEIIEFDKNEIQEILRKIMSQFDRLFIRLGNDVISHVAGFINTDKHKVVSKLKDNLDSITTKIRKYGDDISRIKLDRSLHRLSADDMNLTQTEGIVFRYKSHMLKLTGSFSPLNQILGLQNV